MAGEDIQITVGVSGNRDIKTLNDNVSKVEASVKKLAAGLDSGRISSSAFEKAITQQSDKLKKLKFSQDEASKAVDTWAIISLDAIAAEKASSKAKQEAIAALKAEKLARKEASDAAKLDKIAKQEAALAAKQEALTLKLLADAERDLQDARQKIIASTQQEAAVVDQLKSKYQVGYRELKLYKAEHEQLGLAFEKGIISKQQLRVEQDKLSASFNKGTGIFSAYSQQMKSGANRAGVAMQQFGYQAGDFIVQVQSGTNAFVAFGQQATQMVGFLPMMIPPVNAAGVAFKFLGMSIGAITLGLSIIIPLATAFGAYWMRTSESTDKAKNSLSELEERIKSINGTLKDWVNTKKAASAGMTVEEMFGSQNADQAQKALEKAKKNLEGLTGKPILETLFTQGAALALSQLLATTVATKEVKDAILEVIEAEQTLANVRAKESEERISNFLDQEGSMQEELSMMREIATFGKDSAQVRNLEAQQRISNANAEIDRQVVALKLTEDQGKALKELNLKLEAERANELKNSVGQAYLDAIGLGNTNVETGINKAAEAARILAERMGISLAAATAMVNLSNPLRDYKAKGELNKNMTGRGLPSGFGSGIVGGMTSSPRPLQRSMDLGPTARSIRPLQRPMDLMDLNKKNDSGGVAGKIDTQEEYLAKLSREYDMKKKSLGMTDQQIKRNEFIFTLDEKIATMKSKVSDTEIEALRQQSIAAFDLYQAAEKQAAIMTSVTSSLETMFMSFVDGTKSVGDAFKGMLRDIILAIYRQQVAESAARGIGGFFKGLFSANGNVFSGGSHVNAYADGGVVGGPTYFPMSGGKTGLMGEAGPEAIMPLKRGANGKLGVQVDGNSGGNITVVQHNSFGAGVSRAEIQAMMPKIVETTKAAVLDAKKRGGSYGSAFA